MWFLRTFFLIKKQNNFIDLFKAKIFLGEIKKIRDNYDI
jgi:hypothetical protein